MQASEERRFTQLLWAMAATFRVETSEALIAGYLQGLGDLALEQIEGAMAHAMKHARSMPTPAVLRSFAPDRKPEPLPALPPLNDPRVPDEVPTIGEMLASVQKSRDDALGRMEAIQERLRGMPPSKERSELVHHLSTARGEYEQWGHPTHGYVQHYASLVKKHGPDARPDMKGWVKPATTPVTPQREPGDDDLGELPF